VNVLIVAGGGTVGVALLLAATVIARIEHRRRT
jgi:hypothetical protein